MEIKNIAREEITMLNEMLEKTEKTEKKKRITNQIHRLEKLL